jgi:hypothetical protein
VQVSRPAEEPGYLQTSQEPPTACCTTGSSSHAIPPPPHVPVLLHGAVVDRCWRLLSWVREPQPTSDGSITSQMTGAAHSILHENALPATQNTPPTLTGSCTGHQCLLRTAAVTGGGAWVSVKPCRCSPDDRTPRARSCPWHCSSILSTKETAPHLPPAFSPAELTHK